MKLIISMDDTDNLESQGTGWLVDEACTQMRALGWGHFSMISRHQLFVHPEIPYTSHNSSMVFEATTDVPQENIIEFLSRFLVSRSAPGSDPGLCVTPELLPEAREAIVSFGLRAKKEVLTKDQAYALARELGVHLSEHGGTGGGVIGALAGVGLRLWGNDGRYRSWFHFGPSGEIMTTIKLKTYAPVEDIRTADGRMVAQDARIVLCDQIKTVRMGGKSTLLVHPANADMTHAVFSKEEIKRF